MSAQPSLPLTYLVREPKIAAATPPLLVLLHGVGSNEEDLFGLADALDPRFLVLSARAPYARGAGAYGWFEVAFTPEGPVINPEQAEASRQTLLRFVEAAVAAYGADASAVYLMGFSQGAIMSASVALTEPERVAGAVLMSGRILPEIRPLIAAPERLTGLPLLVVHGTADRVLPILHGRASRDLLETLPVDLDYREYSMGHEVTNQSLGAITLWLRAHLDRRAPEGSGA